MNFERLKKLLTTKKNMEDIVIVTRHKGLIEALQSRGIDKFKIIKHASEENVKDKIVLGVLPLYLASKAKLVIELSLDIPLEKRGLELSKEDVFKYLKDIKCFSITEEHIRSL